MSKKKQNKAGEEHPYVAYVGNGDFLPGLPTVNISLPDWELFPEETRKTAVALGLYRLPSVEGGQIEDQEVTE